MSTAEFFGWSLVILIILNVVFVGLMWWRAARIEEATKRDDAMHAPHGDLPGPNPCGWNRLPPLPPDYWTKGD